MSGSMVPDRRANINKEDKWVQVQGRKGSPIKNSNRNKSPTRVLVVPTLSTGPAIGGGAQEAPSDAGGLGERDATEPIGGLPSSVRVDLGRDLGVNADTSSNGLAADPITSSGQLPSGSFSPDADKERVPSSSCNHRMDYTVGSIWCRSVDDFMPME